MSKKGSGTNHKKGKALNGARGFDQRGNGNAPALPQVAQSESGSAHEDLEEQIRQQTAELSFANRLLNTIIDTIPAAAHIADAESTKLKCVSAVLRPFIMRKARVSAG